MTLGGDGSQSDSQPEPSRKVKLSRRGFLQSAGVVAFAVGGHKLLDWVAPLAVSEELETGDGQVPSLVPSICGMCPAQCGILAYVGNGQALKIEGNYRHSHSHGRLCARGSAGIKLLQNWQRLKSPLKKTAGGGFERISWEQALYEISARLNVIKSGYGPESLAWISAPSLSQDWDRQFMKAFGSPNFFSMESLYRTPVTVASRYTVGEVPVPDLENSKHILVVGHEYGENIFVRDLEDLMTAKDRGAAIVVIDPRLTRTAAQAQEWVPVRPGTEGILMLALAHIIIAEDLYDSDFVANHVHGFEEFSLLASDVIPGWAAQVSGVPVDTIARIAHDLARARPSCVVDAGFNTPWDTSYGNSVQTVRAALGLNALLGNFNAPGGLIMPIDLGEVGKFSMPPTDVAAAARADGAAGPDYPLALESEGMAQLLPQIISSKKPYPIRALVVNGCNPVLDLPNSRDVEAALKQLDLLVVIDFQGSETGDMADYLLAESSYLERYDPVAVSQRLVPEIGLRQPVVATMYDTKPSFEIIDYLAQASGLGRYFDFTLEDILRRQLAATGLELEELKKTGVWRQEESSLDRVLGFKTPSGKIEIYSERFLSAGFDPLPNFAPPAQEPDGRSFRLLTGSDPVHTGSATQNNPWLNYLSGENVLLINADRADRMAIGNGDTVWVKSSVGELKVQARTTHRIHPEAVFLTRGFGHYSPRQRLSYGRGVNVNALVEARADLIAGGAMTGETIVTVTKRPVSSGEA